MKGYFHRKYPTHLSVDCTAIEILQINGRFGWPHCEWLEPSHHTHPCCVATSTPLDQEMLAEGALPEQPLYYRKSPILSHLLSSQTL